MKIFKAESIDQGILKAAGDYTPRWLQQLAQWLFTHRYMIVLVSLSLFILAGCGTMRQQDPVRTEHVPIVVTAEAPTKGAIFQSGVEVRLWEDLKAGRVGDILTVKLVERTTASKNAATSVSKKTDATLGNPTVLGRPVTSGGIPILQGSASSESDFEGSGQSSQSNSLIGDITVTVTGRLPNGNLRIQGEKWVTLNQGKEFIRLTGIIRPYDIGTDNSIASNKIANAQIAYSSRGVVADANRMGLIGRFFNSVLNPF